MAKKLLSKKLKQSIHIALFFFVALIGYTATAQTVLLPGDMVIVSANADTQSIDFIPLIDIEEGTSIYFSNGNWDESTQTLTGQEIEIVFQQDIPAGTNIHVNAAEDSRFATSGELMLEGGTFRLFAYQKEEGIHRFVYALGWGKGHIWNKEGEPSNGSDLPASLLQSEHSYLTLGDASNHQYYIRNGASGSRKLLKKFVSDPSHWRSNEEKPFPIFGTSFNLLAPPIILFDQSISTVEESDSVATLNVAIYEHDGSRLSVDVVFDSLRSITTSSDFNSFSARKLNFTGLIGDGVYEVNVPINDDDIYEGRETGIFTLENLTKGNFGDFLTHSLIVMDNEQPEVLIAEVVNSTDGEGFVDIKNMEDGVVSLSGWSLESGNQRFVFDDKAVLYPFETIRFKDNTELSKADSSAANVIPSTLKNTLLRRGGGDLILKDFEGNVIATSDYSRVRRSALINNDRDEVLADSKSEQNTEQSFDQNTSAHQITILEQVTSPGLKVLVNPEGIEETLPDLKLYGWSEEEQRFIGSDENVSAEPLSQILFGFVGTDEMEEFSEWQQSETSKKINLESSVLSMNLSGTDENGNDVVDGLEGLNLIYNNLDQAFKVDRFLELMSSEYPELITDSKVYGIQQDEEGELNFKAFSREDEIKAGAPFWVLLQNHQQETEITLDQDQLLQPAEEILEDSETQENRGHFEITLASENQAEAVQLHFIEEGIIESTKDLNSYSRLFMEQPEFLNMAFSQGEDYFSELTLSSNMEQALELPVTFSTNAQGKYTLSVTGWEDIPADWEILIEDVANEKEYNLRKEFSLTFEHTLSISNSEIKDEADSELDKASLEDYTVSDKFVIHIRPKGSQIENDEDTDALPKEIELHQNFPNPFNPATTISFYLPESEEVRLSIFNIVGQPVAVITEGRMSAGEHQFEWDATDLPSGMYIYQLEVGKNVMTRKMTLVK